MSEFDAVAKARQQTRIVERAWKGSSAGFRIQVAVLNLDAARERNNRSSAEVCHWKLRLAISEWESRTGLNHAFLLKGTHGCPYGQEGEVAPPEAGYEEDEG